MLYQAYHVVLVCAAAQCFGIVVYRLSLFAPPVLQSVTAEILGGDCESRTLVLFIVEFCAHCLYKNVLGAVLGIGGVLHENVAYPVNGFKMPLVILIFNQPTDKSSAEISPFFVKLPCRAASPPAVAFLDWSYFICRLCL